MFKIVPDNVTVVDRNRAVHLHAPVLRVLAHPPGQHPKRAFHPECVVLEIVTPYGSRFQGVKRAVVTSRLRMMFEVWSGCESDELIAKWPDPDPTELREVK